MKIQCDFCSKQDATVFCLADEAALCNVCDQRVHQANKLASRHKRFDLLDSSPSHMPLCDICQERKALLFCQQDRAILCRDCDPLIHQTHEHNRFLLAGIKLSTTLNISLTSTTTTKIAANANSVTKQHDSLHPFSFNLENIVPPKISTRSCCKLEPDCNKTNMKNAPMDYYRGSASTISEYLTKILPGWKVEDLLDSIASPPTLSEGMDDDTLALFDVGLHGRISSYANYEMGVPEAANSYAFQDQWQALPGKTDMDLQRKINTEKFNGSRKSSIVISKRKRPLL